jgi:serine/threonine protein kinase
MDFQLTCGVWVVSWQSSSLDTQSSLVRTSKSSLHASWKFLDHQKDTLSKRVREGSYSSVSPCLLRAQPLCTLQLTFPPDSFNKPRTFISAKGRRRKPSSKSLRQALKCEDEPFLDFVARCLRWDPDKRMKPEEALKHSFITGMRMSAPPRSRGSAFDSSSRFSSRNYGSPSTSTSRPLPEPPAATSTVKPRVPASPLKSANSLASGLQSSYGSQSKRNSIVGGSTVSVNSIGGIKRTSTTGSTGGSGATGTGSNLPRMSGRPGSGKIPTPP